jgi:hypothetical protein
MGDPKLGVQRKQEYFQHGYTLYPDLLDRGRIKELLSEIDRICGENTLAAHDKSRLEMEPDQPPAGKLVRRIYQPCTYYPKFVTLNVEDRSLAVAARQLIEKVRAVFRATTAREWL